MNRHLSVHAPDTIRIVTHQLAQGMFSHDKLRGVTVRVVDIDGKCPVPFSRANRRRADKIDIIRSPNLHRTVYLEKIPHIPRVEYGKVIVSLSPQPCASECLAYPLIIYSKCAGIGKFT